MVLPHLQVQEYPDQTEHRVNRYLERVTKQLRNPATHHPLVEVDTESVDIQSDGRKDQYIAYQMVSFRLDTPQDTAQFGDRGNLRAGSFAPPFAAIASHRIERRLNTDLPMAVDTVQGSSIEEATSCVQPKQKDDFDCFRAYGAASQLVVGSPVPAECDRVIASVQLLHDT
ncbi:hypothetical protein PG991_009279 [Apiospora marii]|uniref:Uncharacterized protein n=1 Tax=Apiospora marii TaxID=335849 RepID=A0ABR1RLI1_9PEZI